MNLRRCFRSVPIAASTLLALGLLWQATAAEKPPATADGNRQRALQEKLGGGDRYLTVVSTDKPIYRAGESLYVRAVMLHHATRQPLPEGQPINAVIEIQGPKGDTVASGQVNSVDSVLGFSWQVPEGQAGGEYTIKVTHPFTGHTAAERKFDIRSYRAPRLKSQIKFLRDGYGPGDAVAATLEVERAEGGVPAGAEVSVLARVDGVEAYRGTAHVNDRGFCDVRFKLPVAMDRGEGTLALTVADGGVVETATKTIPILLQTVDLSMYPEGGELVAGLPNRVYFEAFTPAKKPADLAGVVVDEQGQEVARFRSAHEGRGRFSLKPTAGGKYFLKITQPAGIDRRFPLPDVADAGVSLSAKENVTAGKDPVQLTLSATAAGRYNVTLKQRERELDAQSIELAAGGEQSLSLQPGTASGVLIATVWDADGTPLAERLLFRQPAEALNIKITADAPQYVPGGKVKLTVATTDSAGKPVTGVVGLSVTDDSVLEMIDRREQSPRLPVMVLLEGEVRDLADAHVYFDAENQDAPQAIDLLLGTQGWRRFGMINLPKFLAEHGDDARRALALRIVTRREQDRFHAADERVPRAAFFGGAIDAPAAVPPPAAAPLPKPEIQADAAPAELKELAQPLADNRPVARPAPVESNLRPARDAEFDDIAGDPNIAPAKEAELQNALEKAAKRDAARQLIAKDRIAIRNDFVSVRIYSHAARPNRQPSERSDFTETLFWHAGVKTDAETGTATVEFDTSDAVTSFRVFADAFDSRGALGAHNIAVESVEPFYLEPKLPLEVTAGDQVLVPLGLVNATGAALDGVDINVALSAGLTFQANPLATGSLPADSRVREMLAFSVGQHNGPVQVDLTATAGSYRDQVKRSLVIKPQGFPIEVGHGGMLSPGGSAVHEFTIPDSLVASSSSTRIVVYPTPLASLTESLERLIREPYGCFEQTSSSTYPLVMAQQYFMSHTGVDPSLVERSSQMLAKGYDRLTGFECASGGYEWFGGDPGHEALTAYGLLEFTDMAQVHPVDKAMLDRTRAWLLKTRTGDGNFTRNRRALHTWVTDPECSNAYILWALLEAGETTKLDRELAWVRDAAEKTQNSYVIALGANVLALGNDAEGANHLLDKLAGLQTDDGSLKGASGSIVGSGGEALEIETTSLAVLAWLRNPRYAGNVEKSIQYLAESCKGGRFGSTQSTVLALRAIVAYDQSRARPKAPGSLQLLVDGQMVGEPVKFTADTEGAIELPGVAELLTPGEHKIEVRMTGGSQMPYSVTANYNTLQPVSSEECKVYLEATLRDEKLTEGDITEAEVVVINRTGEPIPTPMAIVGIPGGLEVRHDQLKELVKAGKIDAYEVLGREVVLYWRSLDKEQRVELPLSLLAAIPGKYTGPASRSYLYYTDEHKQWTPGLKIDIAPKGNER